VILKNQNDVHVTHAHVKVVIAQNDAIVAQNKKDLIRGPSRKNNLSLRLYKSCIQKQYKYLYLTIGVLYIFKPNMIKANQESYKSLVLSLKQAQ
jgi:hypothetical protein